MENSDFEDISDTEEAIDRISNIYKRQNESFSQLMDMFETLVKSFQVFFPCFECIRARLGQSNPVAFAHMSSVLTSIAGSLGQMYSDLTSMRNNFRILDTIFDMPIGDLKNQFWDPAIEVVQLLIEVHKKAIGILNQLKGLVEEGKSMLTAMDLS